MDRAQIATDQWRRERPEFELLPMEVLGRLAEAALLVSRNHLEPLFARYGLQQGEFDVLATLRRSGAPYALTPTQLYDATMVSSGGMTNRLDRLEKSELIERRPNPDDRRGTLVILSKKGLELIERAVPAHLENEFQLMSCMSQDEQHQLNGLLAKLIENVS
jgi:DNA-binding MarR family transcriptional regulator